MFSLLVFFTNCDNFSSSECLFFAKKKCNVTLCKRLTFNLIFTEAPRPQPPERAPAERAGVCESREEAAVPIRVRRDNPCGLEQDRTFLPAECCYRALISAREPYCPATFSGLVFRCIEAKFCKKILVGNRAFFALSIIGGERPFLCFLLFSGFRDCLFLAPQKKKPLTRSTSSIFLSWP